MKTPGGCRVSSSGDGKGERASVLQNATGRGGALGYASATGIGVSRKAMSTTTTWLCQIYDLLPDTCRSVSVEAPDLATCGLGHDLVAISWRKHWAHDLCQRHKARIIESGL